MRSKILPIGSEKKEGFVPIPDIKPVVFLRGSPEEMGYQYGFQAAAYIQKVLNGIWDSALRACGGDRKLVEKYLEKYEQALLDQLPDFAPHAIEQIRGTAKGCSAAGYNIDYTDIWLACNKTGLLWALPSEKQLESEVMGCSMMTAWGSATKDRNPIGAQNRENAPSYWGYEVVLISYPKEGYGYATIGIPTAGSGIHEVWFMNEKGLTQVVTNGMGRRPEDRGFGVGYEMMVWAVSRTCANTKEAIDLVTGTQKTMAVNYGYIDENGNGIVAEASHDFNYVRYPGDYGETDWIHSTARHFIIPEAEVGYAEKPRRGSSPYLRYFTYHRLIEENFGKIDFDVVKKIVTCHDSYDPDRDEWSYGVEWEERTPCAHSMEEGWGAQSPTITLPKDRVAFIGSGSVCGDPRCAMGATGEYVKLTLRDTPRDVVSDAKQVALHDIHIAIVSLREVKDSGWYIWLRNRIEEAWEYYYRGQNSLVNAGIAEDTNAELIYFGEAATHFCKAQAYSKQVKTRANRL